MSEKIYETHGLDNQQQVFFYEQEHYVLSNFSSFQVFVFDRKFPTSEHAYHWAKFPDDIRIGNLILNATSAHAAFKLAESYKDYRRKDWDEVKVSVMREILIEKVKQHPYVFQKLMNTGDRELIENSWRDDVWGWGPNKDGQNLLGKLWMEIRSHIKKELDEQAA